MHACNDRKKHSESRSSREARIVIPIGVTCSRRKITIFIGFMSLDTCWDNNLYSLCGLGKVFVCRASDGGDVFGGGEPTLWCFCLAWCKGDLVGVCTSLGGCWRGGCEGGAEKVKKKGSDIGMHLEYW